VTNHKSVLQTGTTDPARSHRIGVTSDEAENPPRLRVTYGEDSKESKPPFTSPSRDAHRRVGGQRGTARLQPFSNRPPPNRTCGFYRIRLSSSSLP
jgi:hypothetical protein